MSRPLFANLEEAGQRLAAARDVLVCLDFDGTLAPIVEIPEMASLPPATRRILRDLSSKRHARLVIISGRQLADLRSRVGIEGVIYAGNHGFEIGGPGVRFIEPTAAARRENLRQLCGELSARLRHIEGAQVEDKGLSASVHFRRVARGHINELRQIVDSSVTSTGDLFFLKPGHEIYEIRPRVDWHKGTAVRWIAEALGKTDSLPVYVGDDATDEDAFSALPEGVTVKVGCGDQTSAHYCVASPADVCEFLVWLASQLK